MLQMQHKKRTANCSSRFSGCPTDLVIALGSDFIERRFLESVIIGPFLAGHCLGKQRRVQQIGAPAVKDALRLEEIWRCR